MVLLCTGDTVFRYNLYTYSVKVEKPNSTWAFAFMRPDCRRLPNLCREERWEPLRGLILTHGNHAEAFAVRSLCAAAIDRQRTMSELPTQQHQGTMCAQRGDWGVLLG
eukprot:3780121-Pyramimonas_sp.AAC.1